MTAAEGSLLGLAIQSAYDVPEDRDEQFKYLLFSEGSVAPNNVVLPLDPEVGGGALTRNVVKVAVNSGGALALIPRPETLGMFLYGVTGKVASTRNLRADAVFADHALDGTTVNSGIPQPSTGTKITIVGSATANGNITINGTVSGSPDTEDIALNGTTPVEGTKVFTAITSVVFPTDAGQTADVGWYDGSYTHVFTMDLDDMFSAPFWTLRSQLSVAAANDWGEQFQDAKVNMFAVEYRAPGFLRGSVGFIGGKPTPIADTSAWDGLTYIDSGPQFLTSVGSDSVIQLPTGTNLKVLSGSFAAGSAIPLDESYIVGSYFPVDLNVVSRQFGLNMQVRLDDETLYEKMQYDPSQGGTWSPEILREARIRMKFYSDQDAATVKVSTETADARPYLFQVEGNGQTGDGANVAWSMSPVGLRAQRQVVANLSGVFLASPNPLLDPIKVTIVNRRASYAYVTP